MARIHLFEFEDLSWFPNSIRESMTDYLGFVLEKLKFYEPVAPLLEKKMAILKLNTIIDICSGSGLPVKSIFPLFNEKNTVKFLLTDKFPNLSSYKKLKESSGGSIDYVESSVDAMNVPEELKGLRTIFSAIHHFGRDQVKRIIKDTIKKNMPIGIFDSGDKNILTILGIIFVHPIIFFFATPFIKPFRWNRIIFTYFIPIIPLCTVWDGIVSILRLYSPKMLLKLAKEADENEHFYWESGKVKNNKGFKIVYLTGIPNK